MSLGTHASFITASYGFAAVVLLSLLAWLVFDHRAQRRALDELESQGVTRRSDGAGGRA